MSWDEAFADRYEEWSARMTADIPFYTELAVEADGPLVELAVGNGRVAIPVARATGQRVIGIDTSPAMLDQARSRAAAAGVELDLREGDMRELALAEPASRLPTTAACTYSSPTLERPASMLESRARTSCRGTSRSIEDRRS